MILCPSNSSSLVLLAYSLRPTGSTHSRYQFWNLSGQAGILREFHIRVAPQDNWYLCAQRDSSLLIPANKLLRFARHKACSERQYVLSFAVKFLTDGLKFIFDGLLVSFNFSYAFIFSILKPSQACVDFELRRCNELIRQDNRLLMSFHNLPLKMY